MGTTTFKKKIKKATEYRIAFLTADKKEKGVTYIDSYSLTKAKEYARYLLMNNGDIKVESVKVTKN